MKKFNCLMFFALLWTLPLAGLSFAGPPGTSPAPAGQSVPLPGVKVIPDNFGGYLYFFSDSQGSNCATNSTETLMGSNGMAGYGPVSPDPGPFRVVEERPVDLAEAEDAAANEPAENSETEEAAESISDPLEPINRVFFHFNDKLYFWVLKPLATGYKALVPEPARVSVKNFFDNLAFPIRFVNCLFQGKFKGMENELGRFLMNSTFGVAGFFDLAKTHYSDKRYDEDLGQTFGFHGAGPGFFINWPVLGPSCVRDSFGMAGDSFLDPVNWEVDRTKYKLAIMAFKKGNELSLTLGEYEDLKKAALDPYVAFRDAYFQYRRNKIKE